MPITLPLETMSVNDKLQVMESIWLSFPQNSDDFESPDWHADVLAECERKIADGTSKFEDWETAKRSLRAELQSCK